MAKPRRQGKVARHVTLGGIREALWADQGSCPHRQPGGVVPLRRVPVLVVCAVFATLAGDARIRDRAAQIEDEARKIYAVHGRGEADEPCLCGVVADLNSFVVRSDRMPCRLTTALVGSAVVWITCPERLFG